MNPMMVSLKWVIAAVVVVALIGIGVWSYTQLAPSVQLPGDTVGEQEKPAPDLTIDQIKNATYRIDGATISLVNGTATKTIETKGKNGQTVSETVSVSIYNDKIAIGDIDKDGDKDAAVVLTMNTGGTGEFRALVYVENTQGTPTFNAATDLGDRIVVNEIAVNEHAINLDMVVHSPSDGLCCPTQQQESTYMVFEDAPIAPENTNTNTNTDTNAQDVVTNSENNSNTTGSNTSTPEENTNTGGTLVEVQSELERIQAFCEKEGHTLQSELISVGQFDQTAEVESVVVCRNASTQLYHIYILEAQGSGQIVADIQATEIEQDFSHQQANVQQIDLGQDGVKELLIVAQINSGACSYLSSIAHIYAYPTRTLYSKQIMKSANATCDGYLPPEVTYSNNVGTNTGIRGALDFALQNN